MKKSARKILSLVLILVLICTIATVTLATSAVVYDETPGGISVELNYEINTRSVYSDMMVEHLPSSTYVKASITYDLFQSGSFTPQNYTISDDADGDNYISVGKEYSSTNIRLENATFKYTASMIHGDYFSRTISGVDP